MSLAPSRLPRDEGLKKGDLSKFIEQAVRAAIFHRSVRDIQSRNADTDPERLQELIDSTVDEVRARKRSTRKRHNR